MAKPKKIEEYEILGKLGKGSFGIVYKAKNKDGELVAVKQLLERNIPNQDRYHQGELDVIDLKLKHENIVKVYQYYTPNTSTVKKITIAMELCEAGDLAEYYLANNPEVATRFNFMVDMAKGVSYLHNHGIVHRDLKPENVLMKHLTTRLVCKISDFGISKIQQKRDEMFSTQIGSFAYMAPEVMEHQKYSKAVDIFALGLLFFVSFKRSILTNGFSEEALIPGYLNQQKNIIYFNMDILKEKLDENDLIDCHFKGSETVGKLIIGMIKADPEIRIEMEHVLVEITEEKVRHEMHDKITKQNRSIQDLQDTVREKQSSIQSLEVQSAEIKGELHMLHETSEQYRQQHAEEKARYDNMSLEKSKITKNLEKLNKELLEVQSTAEKYRNDLSNIQQERKNDQARFETKSMEQSKVNQRLEHQNKTMRKELHTLKETSEKYRNELADLLQQQNQDKIRFEAISLENSNNIRRIEELLQEVRSKNEVIHMMEKDLEMFKRQSGLDNQLLINTMKQLQAHLKTKEK